MSNSIHRNYVSRFKEAYAELNDQQRKAVESIQGPVAVIAGPGTGKTQILALRIGNILSKTDAQAHNILCLTYTEAGASAMRNRLIKIIGPEAHKINIFTYHGFANKVIRENLNIFGGYRDLELLSDLEKIDVSEQLTEGLAIDHPMKGAKGGARQQGKRMLRLFEIMKKENLNEDIVNERIDEFLERCKEDPVLSDKHTLYAKRKYTNKKGKVFIKGDFRDDNFEKLKKKFTDLRLAAAEFDNYNDILEQRARFDYHDMILWVVKAFEEDQDLLLNYQEQFHFVLVDEYQDTNGSQNRLLELLIEFWGDQPDVFIVGDPDQAIYKFQGASSENLDAFVSKYQVEPIRLVNNYRSNQVVLDTSTTLINYPLSTHSDLFPEQTARSLIASGPFSNDKTEPLFLEFENTAQEQAYLTHTIKKLWEEKGDLSDCAILYRNHKQITEVAWVFEKQEIPFNIKKKVDVLKDPLIDNLINILKYLNSEFEKPNSDEKSLFELMHYDFFNIAARDVAKIYIYLKSEKDENLKCRDVMASKAILEELNLKTIPDILRLSDLLEKWTSDIANVTIQMLLENILNEGGVLHQIFSNTQKSWLLQLVGTLFNFIKNETSKKPEMGLADFIEVFEKMEKEELPLEVNRVSHNRKGINFMTAHSAKGKEFEKVFLFGCTKNSWEKKRTGGNSFSFPDNINADNVNTEDDERRLFYVAMTRAKKDLVISYSVKSEDGKELGKSQFIDEILSESNASIQHKIVDQEIIDQFQYLKFLKANRKPQLIEKELVAKVLENYSLSVTGMNKYLRCQMTFYFENIITVPSARTIYTGFGNAIHYAFQEFYNKNKTSLEHLLGYFEDGMNKYKSHFTFKEFNDLLGHGKIILGKYYKNYDLPEKGPKSIMAEHEIKQVEYKGVPIKGILDKVLVYDNYVEVVDYKTGKSSTKSAALRKPDDNEPLGGEYWRQIVFYKILLQRDPRFDYDMTTGYMDFVEPDKKTEQFVKRKFVPSPDDLEIVGNLITETWQNIQDHKFDTLCDDEKCYWCDFVRNDYVYNHNLKDELEHDEYSSMESYESRTEI